MQFKSSTKNVIQISADDFTKMLKQAGAPIHAGEQIEVMVKDIKDMNVTVKFPMFVTWEVKATKELNTTVTR
tara:strand:+ start:7137 stop:7352 length:216 start_codon:yes stop_codon:yes gene_type:complete